MVTAVLSGPKVQLPQDATTVLDPEGNLTQPWRGYLTTLQHLAYNPTRSGPTTLRPTSTMVNRWIGMNFYDTSLHKPIWLDSVNPDVWHDATGAIV